MGVLNEKMYKSTFIIILLIILFSFIIYYNYNIQNNFENFENNNIEIVVARYNENLEWLKEEPFNKYPTICYNSGKNTDFYKPENMKIINIEYIGKEAYTYIYHIINCYDNLANITIFLPGSTNSIHKLEKAKQQVYEIEKHKNTVFISFKYNDIRNDIYDFILDEWCSTSVENIKENAKCKLNPSKIRPFGKWYDHFFTGKNTQYFNTCGILGIHKKHIIQNTKEYYQTLLNEFEEPNDEVAHYFERAWEAIFYPMHDAIFIT